MKIISKDCFTQIIFNQIFNLAFEHMKLFIEALSFYLFHTEVEANLLGPY